MEKNVPTKKGRSKAWIAFPVALVLASAFFVPVLGTRISANVWYPYAQSPSGLASVTYRYLGVGAVYWTPNHYWLYLGPTTLQITNSSASSLTVRSVDQNGTAIVGYYAVLSASNGPVLGTGYTTVTFPTTPGQSYALQVENYGKCAFSHWSNGQTTTELKVIATSGDHVFTAVYSC